MNIKIRSLFLGAAMLGSTFAQAGFITESEPNDTLAAAQNLDSAFTTGSQAGVIGSSIGWSWASVSQTSGNTYDYFSFTASAAGNWWFDIDVSGDMEIALFDLADSSVIFQQDDGAIDSAVTGLLGEANDDSGLYPERSIALTAGSFAVGVCNFNCTATTGTLTGNVASSAYTLNISTDTGLTPVATVPVPATLALFGLGLAGLGYSRRKKA